MYMKVVGKDGISVPDQIPVIFNGLSICLCGW